MVFSCQGGIFIAPNRKIRVNRIIICFVGHSDRSAPKECSAEESTKKRKNSENIIIGH